MTFLDQLTRMLVYDDWANREALASLRAVGAAGGVPPRALRWMAHIVAVERLWLGRLLGDGESVATWPDLTLDDCAARLDELRERWRQFLAGLGPGDLGRPVSYVNTKGEAWTDTAGDILLQTVTHSVYHRGQIAAELRAAGETPVLTDFIHAVRQGFVD